MGVSGQGYNGGCGAHDSGICDSAGGGNPKGGGGGGSGGIGETATMSNGGDGGIGIQSDITGVLTNYAGGGGGHTYNAGSEGMGGLGGGGDGGRSSGAPGGLKHGVSGQANTGGGGGGNPYASYTTGGSGLVILRTLYNATIQTSDYEHFVNNGFNVYIIKSSGSITF
jgi:hypothetical protein